MGNEIQQLVNLVIENTGWGDVSGWQGGDFRKLSQLIFDKTRVNISESTLRRLLGKADYPHLPSETTLNTLAIFAGYDSWRDFKMRKGVKGEKPAPRIKPGVFRLGAAFILLLSAAAWIHFKNDTAAGFNYVFSSRPVTRTIPNSVIFNYKVGKPGVPVYIQQSWDSHTRAKVAADGDTYASVYYRPGFFLAKLLVGNKVVKEHPLLIPTDGWLGLIYREPVPVYLKASEFAGKEGLEIPPAVFGAHSMPPGPVAPRAELYNVGNFTPADADHAEFSAMLKNDDNTGTGVCGRAMAFLITNGIPISAVICSKGCVAAIGFFNGRALISGRNADLSGFGTEPRAWVKIGMRTGAGRLQWLVNGHIAYEGPLPPKGLKILGVAFGFEGGGAVKAISLEENGKAIFKAY